MARPAALLLPPLLAPALAGQAPVPREAEKAFAREVSEATMTKTVRDLVALGPRMGGTRSGDRAAELVVERFRKAGLEAAVVEDPARLSHEERAFEVRVAIGDEEASPIEGAVPYGFSPSAEGAAPLTLSEPGGEKAVLFLERWTPRGSYPEGVIAVLVDGSGVEGTPFVAMRHQRPSRENGVPVFAVPADAGRRLREALAEGKGVEVAFRLESEIREAAPRTVVATLPGRDRSRHVLVSAHGDADSGGPGADDNASGVAVLLEIARALSACRLRGEVPEPACDLRFAVWGTEIHSTGAYLRREREEDRLDEIVAVLNYDQAGYGTGNDALFVEPDDVAQNETLVRALLGVCADYRGTEGFPNRFTSNRALGGTDSYVFQETRRLGREPIPSVTIFASAFGSPSVVEATAGFPRAWEEEGGKITVDYDRYYHSSGDTPENTTDREPFNMGWCARIGGIGALRLAAQAAR